MSSQQAIAACTGTTTITCTGNDTAGYTIVAPPATGPYTVTADSTWFDHPPSGTQPVNINLNNNNGTATMDAGSAIQSTNTNAVSFSNVAVGTVNINGSINASTGSAGNYDGMRFEGPNNGTLTVNVGPNSGTSLGGIANGTIIGSDDGLVVFSANNSLHVNNQGTIQGNGSQSGGGNAGEGILVSANGNSGGNSTPIGGNVFITNEQGGLIKSANTGGGSFVNASAGNAIHVNTLGDITLSNLATGATSTIDGANGGVWLRGTNVIINNDATIIGRAGDGVNVVATNTATFQNSVNGTSGDVTGYGGHGLNISATNIVGSFTNNVTGMNGDGLHLRASGNAGNAIDMTIGGGKTITGSDDGIDARVTGAGSIRLTNNATVTPGMSAFSDGVRLQTNEGNIDFTNNGAITQAGRFGIDANCEGGGRSGCNITIVNNAAIGSIHATQDDGIRAQSADGQVNVTTNTGGTINSQSSGIIATSGSFCGIFCTIPGGDVHVVVGDTIVAGSNNGISIPFPFSAFPLPVLGTNLGSSVTFGALAFSIGGKATVDVNAAINPNGGSPTVGAASIAFGGSDAVTNVNAPVHGDVIGALALQLFGSGNAIVNVSSTGSVNSNGAGIVVVDAFGTGNSVAV